MSRTWTEYELLLACYRSGQISERQWQEHLRDREFREWVEEEVAVPDRVIMVRESEWREMREALESFVTYGCPVCGGDCASANPPVYGCPMRAAHAALSHPTPLAGGDDG